MARFAHTKSLSFTDDILIPIEKANGKSILLETPVKALIRGTFKGVFLICFMAAIIAIVIGNYTLEQQGPHSPAYQVGKAIPPFLSQNSYLLILPFLVSAVVSWYLVYKPTRSGIVKKHIVFSGNLQPQQLDALTMERAGVKWRPAQGNTLTIYRDFNLDTMVAEKGHPVVYFNDEPAPQPKQKKAKPPQKPRPKAAPKTDEEAVFERRVFDEPDEEKPKAKANAKDKDDRTQLEKLEAVAQDANAPPNVRIAALNKIKKLKGE